MMAFATCSAWAMPPEAISVTRSRVPSFISALWTSRSTSRMCRGIESACSRPCASKTQMDHLGAVPRKLADLLRAPPAWLRHEWRRSDRDSALLMRSLNVSDVVAVCQRPPSGPQRIGAWRGCEHRPAAGGRCRIRVESRLQRPSSSTMAKTCRALAAASADGRRSPRPGASAGKRHRR